jgi:hypothetical protein
MRGRSRHSSVDVVAVDFSRAIEAAARNFRDLMRPLKMVAWTTSVLLAGGVVPYELLARAGATIKPHWPLPVYAKYPFKVLYDDQFNRLFAPLEKHYEAAEG